MVKVSQDSPPYMPDKFFSGEQQGEGHRVVQCVEGEYHQWCFFFSVFKSINQNSSKDLNHTLGLTLLTPSLVIFSFPTRFPIGLIPI